MKNAHAVVVLPPGAHGRIVAGTLRRWLCRGRVSFEPRRSEILQTVLSVIGAPAPRGGLAALRFWGQTGGRSGAWMAAADPVHLETRLRDLRVRALPPEQVPLSDLRALFKTVQTELGADGRFAFSRVGRCGYMTGERSMELTTVSATVAEGQVPDRFTPAGASAAAYHRLLGELQMLLHGHDVNLKRQQSGLPEINSLWFWGGGIAPERVERSLPVLFSDDPLFKGYWQSCGGAIEPWRGDFEDCVATRPRGFVAVTPEAAGDGVSDYLERLAKHADKGDFGRLTLLFRDGLSVDIGYLDRLRFWRRVSPLLAEHNGDE